MEGKNKYFITYTLWIIDMLCIIASYGASTYVRYYGRYDYGNKTQHFLVGVIFMLIATVYSYAVDYNKNFFKRGFSGEIFAVVKYNFIVAATGVIIVYLFNYAKIFSRMVFGIYVILNVVLMLFMHHLCKILLRGYWDRSKRTTGTLLITESDALYKVLARMQKHEEYGHKIVGMVILDQDMKGHTIEGIDVLSNRDSLIGDVTTMAFDEVFICTPDIPQSKLHDIIKAFNDMGVTVHYSMALVDMGGKSEAGMFSGYSVITYTHVTGRYRALMVKRLMDIIGSTVGLVITVIVTPFVALAIKIDSPGPVFFSQVRIGRNGRRFKIWKFRSMYIDAEERKKELEKQNEMTGLMFKMKDDPRITKVGKFIRKTSIDELPQFWNIFVGDMSLIGTRPPTEKEFEQYNQHYRRRLSMTPGLTGMWQVSGRSEIEDFDEIVALDLKYIDNWSLKMDIEILIKTVGVVLFGTGAS